MEDRLVNVLVYWEGSPAFPYPSSGRCDKIEVDDTKVAEIARAAEKIKNAMFSSALVAMLIGVDFDQVTELVGLHKTIRLPNATIHRQFFEVAAITDEDDDKYGCVDVLVYDRYAKYSGVYATQPLYIAGTNYSDAKSYLQGEIDTVKVTTNTCSQADRPEVPEHDEPEDAPTPPWEFIISLMKICSKYTANDKEMAAVMDAISIGDRNLAYWVKAKLKNAEDEDNE